MSSASDSDLDDPSSSCPPSSDFETPHADVAEPSQPGASSRLPVVVEVITSKNDTATIQEASGTTAPAFTHSSKLRRILDQIRYALTQRPVGHSLLHGAGLKPFSLKKMYTGATGREVAKPVTLRSSLLALASLDTHLLPACITIFLVSFNANVFVNGPPISTLGQYALQGASKLHELTIVASLARVITDILRYQLLHEGINFGMLSSPFTFLGLNYLWSQELFGAVQSAFQLKSKVHRFSVVILIAFCILAAIVGPASALLFNPSPAWLSAGSTNFFLLGNEDQLWPRHLAQNHTGPGGCEKGDGGNYWCLQGGWDIIRGFVTPEGVSRRTVNLFDAWTARMMWLHRPEGENTGTDSWASTLHGASVFLGERMARDHAHAWGFARGRQKQLRDATPSGMYNRFIGRIPVVRVVCAPIRSVNRTSPTLLFPVLNAESPWHLGSKPGLSKEFSLEGTYKSLVNATFHSLPSEFGPSTAGLAFVTNNVSTAAGCGCSFDARWAEGVSALHGEFMYWQAFIGPPVLPSALKFADPQRMNFFDPSITASLGPTLTSEDGWIQQLSTGHQLRDSTGNFTALETILISTRLWDVPWALEDAVGPIIELEAVLSAYFVNALSRIGWDLQRNPEHPENANPLLRVGNRDTDALLHASGQLYQRPTDVTTQALRQEWFVYATAWQLRDPALYISVMILGIHLLIAIVHSVAVLRSRQSSESWTSVSEIVALAYVSKSDDYAMKNCGAGIMLQNSLRQRVRVVAVEEKGEHRVQLVACGGKQARRQDEKIVVDRKYG